VVSAIIPARNEEASIARAVASVAAQPEVGEVIVVNDQSTDRTAEILMEMATRVPKLRVLAAGDLPSGWVGKNHAAAVGAGAAEGDWLLFTDADTYHLFASMRCALADAAASDAALVSYSPEQEMESFWERALIPLVFCRLAARFSYSRVNDPMRPDAAANGQFLLVRRDAYEAVGGHAAVAGEILEDVALARRIKRAGYGIHFTAPRGIVRTRMYQSFASMWQGWTKNLYLLVGGTASSVALELTELFPVFEILALAVLSMLLVRDIHVWKWLLPLVLLATLAARHLQYAAALHRNRYPISSVQYYVPGASLYTAALLASWWKNTRGAVVWKGRAYPARSSSGLR
jgi:cellulose synthase/poly-beta-1,6-N-acetylglucosamine synthase-like glycosyltransferase